MMKASYSIPHFCLVLMMTIPFLGVPVRVGAQVTSVSPSLSNSLSDESQTEGFDSSFDPEASNLTNPTLHSDVSDPTHSQLLGSSLTPMDAAYISPYVETNPLTGTISDAQSVIGTSDIHFGGRQGQGFSLGASFAGSQVMRQGAAGTLGTASMQASFGGGVAGRGSYAGLSAGGPGAAVAFSGQSAPSAAMPSGIGLVQAPQTGSSGTGMASETSGGYYATDPVLSGSTAGYEGRLEMGDDLPSPSSQTAQFFVEGSAGASSPLYAFDDGQTPAPGGIPSPPGSVLLTGVDYNPSPTGFPDSTRGLAGLASETSSATSPLSSSTSQNGTLFATGDEGISFSPVLHLVPSLHSVPITRPTFNFEAAERREQEQRLLHGVSISQSSEIYKEDLRKYRRQAGRALPQMPHRDLGAQQTNSQDIMSPSPIR